MQVTSDNDPRGFVAATSEPPDDDEFEDYGFGIGPAFGMSLQGQRDGQAQGDTEQERQPQPNVEMMGMLQSMLQQFMGPNAHIQMQAGGTSSGSTGPRVFTFPPSDTRSQGDRDSDNNTDRTPPPILNLATFLQQAFNGEFADRPEGQAGTGLHPAFSSMFNMVGNPGDYVFGQNALDNIITQMMESAQGRDAPPPADEETISALPTSKVTKEMVDANMDCAVCKEEFVLDEPVIDLPCKHHFHDDCIKPWLKTNGTCPVCRYSLVTKTTPNDNSNNGANDPSHGQGHVNATTSTSSSIPGTFPTEQEPLD